MWTATDVAAANVVGDWQSQRGRDRRRWPVAVESRTTASRRCRRRSRRRSNYFETTFTARRRRRLSPVAAAESAEQLAEQQLGQRAVRRRGRSVRVAALSDRPGARRRDRAAGSLGIVGQLGLGRQRVQRRADAHLLPGDRARYRLRVQQRADGAMVDQIVLSPDAFITVGAGRDEERHDDLRQHHRRRRAADPVVAGSLPPPPPLPSGWQRSGHRRGRIARLRRVRSRHVDVHRRRRRRRRVGQRRRAALRVSCRSAATAPSSRA